MSLPISRALYSQAWQQGLRTNTLYQKDRSDYSLITWSIDRETVGQKDRRTTDFSKTNVREVFEVHVILSDRMAQNSKIKFKTK